MSKIKEGSGGNLGNGNNRKRRRRRNKKIYRKRNEVGIEGKSNWYLKGWGYEIE